MPTSDIIGSHFRVPLRHGIADSFCIVPACSSDLKGNLCFKLHVKGYRLPRQNGLWQIHFQDGFFMDKRSGLTIHGQHIHFHIADLFRTKVKYPVPNPSIRISNGPGTHIHHAIGLESIIVQMIKCPG
ncbi:hypothetical protein B879_03070 [Cecembia lonarensis LW9]|uniref:Uncharacterized protein n=1 Tax=Cecembia lonarensis (strain CCUG 58316 / KCTC 22772 / LW9) TaxID=1225176 RepID=K1LW25_CECL9|nr:hypothetical protein B879_03070 [Cecembia lonarensis LW9]